MRPSKQSGMEGYAKRNDAAPSTGHKAKGMPSMDGCYAEVPSLAGGNAKHENRRKHGNDRGPEPPETAPFYNTDVESLGDSSLAPSAPAVGTPKKDRSQHRAESESSTSPLKSDEEYETDDEERAKRRAAGTQHASQLQRDMALGRGRNMDEVARGWRTIKGDSYPTTTDGLSSESDRADNAAQGLTRELFSKPPAAQYPQGPGIKQRGRRTAAVRHMAAPVETKNATTNSVASNRLSRHDMSLNGASVQPPSNQQGQAHRKPNTLPSNGSVSPYEATNTGHALLSHHFASTSAAAAVLGSGCTLPTHQNNAKSTKPLDRSPAAQDRVDADFGQHSVSQPVPQRTTPPGMPVELPSGTSTERATSPVTENHPWQGEEVELDYDCPELYTMQYSTLKAATFDDDPRADDFTPSGDGLEDKLAAALAQEAEYQRRLFATFNIEQWEDAGDWFLGRFGDIVDRLKHARRDRRAAARKFEDSIEARHDAISKKRKITEDALLRMKQSGQAILDSTPKKARKD